MAPTIIHAALDPDQFPRCRAHLDARLLLPLRENCATSAEPMAIFANAMTGSCQHLWARDGASFESKRISNIPKCSDGPISSKAICLLLSVSVLFMGCFTQSVISKDEPLPEDGSVTFHLRDGTSVKSPAKNHRRIDDGYQVVGELKRGGVILKKFEGRVHDDEIIGVTVEEFNVPGTILLVGGVAAICVGIFELSQFHFSLRW